MILKWSARVLAAVFAGLILVIFLGEIFTQGIDQLALGESLMMLAFFVVWISYLIGWRRELAGGVLNLSGLAVFYLLDYAFSGSFPRGFIFPLMGLPGVLYLLSWNKGRFS